MSKCNDLRITRRKEPNGVGRFVPGGNHPLSKLTEEQAMDAKRSMENGASRGEMARKYNVTRAAMYSLATGRTWSHLHTPKSTHKKHVG